MTTIPRVHAELLDGSGGRRWRLRPVPDLRGYADAGSGLPDMLRVLLAHRGVTATEEARRFLGSPRDLDQPLPLPGIERAVERLAAACRGGEAVAVFGDYDVDGITATCLLVEGLEALGAKPRAYLPDRFSDGYGLNPRVVRQMADTGATLVVTADTGTSSVAEISDAAAAGMDTVVIDHHTVPDVLPEALAIVNPLLDPKAEWRPAAVGVAHRVLHELHERLGVDYRRADHHALVALGTVCDVMPLVGPNRDLVRLGLEALSRPDRPGLRALMEVARVRPERVTVDTIGWALGPRLNAAGRMAHPRLALDLLRASTLNEARTLAAHLDQLNEDRREITSAAMEYARATLTPEDRQAPLLLLESRQMSSGVIGLVAARLAEEHHRPALVMRMEDGIATGSCRSIPGFDVADLLQRHHDLFVRHGGHNAAAGFTVEERRLPELRERLMADAAERLDVAALAPTLDVDVELPLAEITPRLLRWLELLQPHGTGNPHPVFMARGVEVLQARAVGADGTHLQMRVRSGGVEGARDRARVKVWRAISFRNAEHAVAPGELADIVYQLKPDDYEGGNAMQLEILDLRPSA